MHAKGQELGVPIELLIGPETAHKFHPDSLKKYMNFIATQTTRGRPLFPEPAKLKFITYTLKYNRCEWMTIEEQIKPYEPTIVEAQVDARSKTVTVRTTNVAMLRIQPGVADVIVIDGGKPMPTMVTKVGSQPGIYFEKRPEGWLRLDENQSRHYAAHETTSPSELRKRHDLQGPIDDAFMQPFVCVRPTGTAWSVEQTAWSKWTLDRFEREFDKRLRGRVPVVDDTAVTDDMLSKKHFVLFGDPGSNAILAKIVDRLPVKWTKQGIEIQGQFYSSAEYGLAMIYPNPQSPRRYVVVNSGHTFHETEFVNSNANLYPRLGDFGVIKFAAQADGSFGESVLHSDVFDAHWRFEAKSP